MSDRLADLLEVLSLERLEDNLFRGQSRDIGSPRVYGGQVLGQALSAAQNTVDDRVVHSLHAYFLRAGDVNAPIVYDVDRSRDGHSFTSRRVTAIQHGCQIFHMSASFQVAEEGMEHQHVMPDVPPPEDLPDSTHYRDALLEKAPEKMRRFIANQLPFEFRPVAPPAFLNNEKREPRQQLWFRAVGRLPDDDSVHRVLMSYVSDYGLLGTATLPHGISFLQGNVQMASLDHAMWFHRSCRVDDWLLYDCDSPNMTGARGFSRGMIYCRDGSLVASTAQEGLVRIWSLARLKKN